MTSIIVIDDEKDIVSTMSELLELHGMDVVGKGYNGLEAVQLFDKLCPDVVLLDLMMPEYDGLYALKKIREKDPIANIVIVTGELPKSSMDEVVTLKPTKILIKPIDVNILVESFSVESSNQIALKIKYRFKEDTEFYTCTLTYEQYKHFRKLPIVKECEIIKKEEENSKYKGEMQEALEWAIKNDTSHIRKLSKMV